MVTFLGKNIGNGPSFTHKIEEDSNAPTVGTVLKRSDDDRFLVMTLIGVKNFAPGPKVAAVMGGIDASFTRPSKITIRNMTTQCDGFFNFTVRYQTDLQIQKVAPTGVSAAQAKKMEWKKVEVPVYTTDHVVGFLTNLLRPTGHVTDQNKLYTVMPKNDNTPKTQQVHVEQIAMFQLLYLLDFLDGLKGGNNALLFEKDKLSALGQVYFDGLGKDGKPLQAACEACDSVKSKVLQLDKRIGPVALLQNA